MNKQHTTDELREQIREALTYSRVVQYHDDGSVTSQLHPPLKIQIESILEWHTKQLSDFAERITPEKWKLAGYSQDTPEYREALGRNSVLDTLQANVRRELNGKA